LPEKEPVTKMIEWAETALSVLFFTGMFGAIIIQVFYRYFLHAPLVWPYELSVYCYIYIIYVGAVMAARRNSHIAFDILYNRLPQRARLVTGILTNLIVTVSFISILPASIRFIRLFWNVKTSSLGIPEYLVLMSFPLGMALISLCLVSWTVTGLRELKNTGKTQ